MVLRLQRAQLSLQIQQFRVLNGVLLIALVLLDPLIEFIDLFNLSQYSLTLLLHLRQHVSTAHLLATAALPAAIRLSQHRRVPLVPVVMTQLRAGAILDARRLVRRDVTAVVVGRLLEGLVGGGGARAGGVTVSVL